MTGMRTIASYHNERAPIAHIRSTLPGKVSLSAYGFPRLKQTLKSCDESRDLGNCDFPDTVLCSLWYKSNQLKDCVYYPKNYFGFLGFD